MKIGLVRRYIILRGSVTVTCLSQKQSNSKQIERHNTMIINLTQHVATQDQLNAGVIEPAPEDKEIIQDLLTFNALPSVEELEGRAYNLATLVTDMGAANASHHTVMIGGAPFFMGHLEAALKKVGHKPVYAFSKRESVDRVQPDGTVRKVTIFKHLGFVEV